MLDSIASHSICWPFALLWFILMLFLGMLFVGRLNRLINNNKQGHIWLMFVVLFILGTLLYYYSISLSKETQIVGNELQVLLVALLSSLELFIGQTHLYDGIVSAVIFGRPFLLFSFLSVYIFSILFTSVLLFKFITKRWDSRLWLKWHSNKANSVNCSKSNHVFFGINRYSILLGKDILQTNENIGYIVFVDFPREGEDIKEVSVSDLFTNLFKRSDDRLDNVLKGDERVVILKANKHLKEASGFENPMKAIGLKGLISWIDNPNNNGYILSENETDNLQCLHILHTVAKAKINIYCHARKEGVNLQMERFYRVSSGQMNSRIHYIDSTFLAVETLKRKENLDLQPIRFVDIAKDENGKKLGYVSSSFNAMILGFGETGQEMLKFLYEFGSFVGADKKQSDSSFMIFDSNLEQLKGAFLSQCPGLIGNERFKWEELQFDTQGTISTEGIRVDSSDFWVEYEKQLNSLNYIVIALGDDRINTEIGVRLMEFSLQKGKSLEKFLILVRLTDKDSQYAKMIEFYDSYYCEGRKKLRLFGEDQSIWKYEILTRSSLHKEAEAYYAAYAKASADQTPLKTWKERRESILGLRPQGISETDEQYQKYLKGRENKLANQVELSRKEGQDYANCFHAATKLELCDCSFFDTTEYANKIPESLTDRITEHYPEKGHVYDVLENLAIGEHIRWVASHEVSGNIKGEKKSELLRINEYMIPYADIPSTHWDWGNGMKVEQVKHYDWIVVKTTLLIANIERSKLSSSNEN